MCRRGIRRWFGSRKIKEFCNCYVGPYPRAQFAKPALVADVQIAIEGAPCPQAVRRRAHDRSSFACPCSRRGLGTLKLNIRAPIAISFIEIVGTQLAGNIAELFVWSQVSRRNLTRDSRDPSAVLEVKSRANAGTLFWMEISVTITLGHLPWGR